MGSLSFRISWKEPELGRKEYEVIKANAKLSQLLFNIDNLEVK